MFGVLLLCSVILGLYWVNWAYGSIYFARQSHSTWAMTLLIKIGVFTQIAVVSHLPLKRLTQKDNQETKSISFTI